MKFMHPKNQTKMITDQKATYKSTMATIILRILGILSILVGIICFFGLLDYLAAAVLAFVILAIQGGVYIGVAALLENANANNDKIPQLQEQIKELQSELNNLKNFIPKDKEE